MHMWMPHNEGLLPGAARLAALLRQILPFALEGSVPERAAPVQAAFVLPQTFPVTVNTLNYAGVAVGIVMLAALLFWFLPFGLGARRWFRGEIKTAKIPFDSVCLNSHCGASPPPAHAGLRHA